MRREPAVSQAIYVSLLRGINVSGQKKIIMADLKALYMANGLDGAATYIQSGNVVFESNSRRNRESLRKILNCSFRRNMVFTYQ